MSGSVHPNNWHKSSHSGGQADCVEAAYDDVVGMIRDTKGHKDDVIKVSRAAFDALQRSVVKDA